AFKDGIEKTIGSKVKSAVIFDKDYRTSDEITSEQSALKKGNLFVHIHSRKEIENFLLIPKAIDKAIKQRIKEVKNRTGKSLEFDGDVIEILTNLTSEFKLGTQAQLQSHQFKFMKS